MKYLDLPSTWKSLMPRIMAEVEEDMELCRFVGGPRIQRLEEALAEYTGFKHAVCCASGTLALQIACLHLNAHMTNMPWGVPDLTFQATAFAALDAGMNVELVPPTGPDAACLVDIPYCTPTIPVDLYGTPVDWEAPTLYPLIVDGAQSLGARMNGKKPGETNVWAYAVSMYPGKNLGSMGEGGALMTHDGQLAEYARAYINQGQLVKGKHDIRGTNGRMHALQAIPLYHGLQKLDEWNSARRAVGDLYDTLLRDVPGVRTLSIPRGRTPTRHIYPVFVNRAHMVRKELKDMGIPFARHYPESLRQSASLKSLDRRAGRGWGINPFDSQTSLPMHPFLSQEDTTTVADSLKKALERMGRDGQ